jgi:hypothetical protein
MRRKLRVLTWHVHGNYLYYLTQVPHDFFLVVDDARSTQHSGRSGTLPWGDNVHEAHVDRIAGMAFDVVLYQSRGRGTRSASASSPPPSGACRASISNMTLRWSIRPRPDTASTTPGHCWSM